ncbi:MAG: TetR/AcrR family transcriptional regulator [Actinobacteria bacterium]|nr:TetR/AcrR family transcriptional regulator [Actinomycetota bacterium]
MRALAEDLGTGPASLYWHVRNKDELLTLVLDRVIGEVETPDPDPDRWQEQLKEVAREMRRVMGRHRDIARLTLGQIPVGPNATAIGEKGLALLRSAGLPARTCAYTLDLLGLYVGSFSYEESLGLRSPTGEDLPPEEVLAMIRGYWESLPAERFPNTRALLDELMSGSSDERFEWGLDVIVGGLAATADG